MVTPTVAPGIVEIDRQTLRIVVLITLMLLVGPTAADYLTHHGPAAGQSVPTERQSTVDRPNATVPQPVTVTAGTPDQSPAARTATTVTAAAADGQASDLVYVVDALGPGQLTVIEWPNGTRVFTTSEYELYHDVDPSPVGSQTLLYVASNVRSGQRCPDQFDDSCTIDVIERLNYSTGETVRLFERTVNYNGSSNIHDVDRISNTEVLLADIQYDRISVVNVTTDEVVWSWEVAAAFNRSVGGRENDWTHLNDVEVLNESLYMVSLRNLDQVVFVHRELGLLDSWTLGANTDNAVLYEQHNPDYIPPADGGPAILVADSENNRIVEYQRRNGSWELTWEWTDERLQWPRDADRLPNGNTLVTDTHGARLLEVTPNGTVVNQHRVPRGVYEAELLESGPESEGGASMARLRESGESTDVSSITGAGTLRKAFLGLFPPLVLHGFLAVLPTWISPFAGGTLLLAVVVGFLWMSAEGVGRFRTHWPER